MRKMIRGRMNFETPIKRLINAFRYGSWQTRLTFFLPGLGQILRRQFVKGGIYLALTALFAVYMSAVGFKYFGHFFSGNLGTALSGEVWNEELQIYEKVLGDNSFLILLYGVATIVLTIAYLWVWSVNVFGSAQNDKILKSGGQVLSFRQDLEIFLNEKFYLPLLFPPFLGLVIFTVLPLIFMVLIAFTNYDYQHLPPGKLFDWVGIENFKALFSLSGGTSSFAMVFVRVLIWTFVWAFFATFSNYFLGMLIALMINRKGIKLKKLWRTLFVIAIAVPQFVTLLLMQKILDTDGILNKLLGMEILWLTDQRYLSLLPRITIILVNIWIGVPYTLLMCSGILMNIPSDYYEAARIDGASPVKIFFKITLPYALHITTPYLITQFVGNINNFNVIWLLTKGGPVDNINYGGGTQAQSTDLLVTWLYRLTTDVNPRYNVASVIGIVIFVICSLMSIIVYNRSSSARNEEEFQ